MSDPFEASDSTSMEIRMKSALVGLFAVVTMTACASKGSSMPEESGPIVGTWQQTSSEDRVGANDWAPSATAECRLGSTEEYEADGTWTLFGTRKCEGSGSGVRKGTWQFAANKTKIIYTYEGISGEYASTIETLNETELVLTKFVGDVAGTETRAIYRKQSPGGS